MYHLFSSSALRDCHDLFWPYCIRNASLFLCCGRLFQAGPLNKYLIQVQVLLGSGSDSEKAVIAAWFRAMVQNTVFLSFSWRGASRLSV